MKEKNNRISLWDAVISETKLQKSPLRYPGGKSRAIEAVCSLIPSETKTLLAPFFGGGSIEIACASAGIKVTGSDVFNPLYCFWKELKKDAEALAEEVEKYYPLDKKSFYELQSTILERKASLEKAAIFFVINRSSFSGSTFSGGMSPDHPRFNESSIQRLRDFDSKNISVKNESFEDFLEKNSADVIYLDPPYLLENSTLYGVKGSTHKEFDHEKLSKILRKKKSWILSYNDCAEVRELYDGYLFLTPEWKYGMSKNKESKEVIILSKDLSSYWRVK